MRIDLTDTERDIISGKTRVSQSYRRNVHMHTKRKANKMIENLLFLAEHLPESQQKQIFFPEKISNLFKTLLEYRVAPKSGEEKIQRIRGQKYQHPTEKTTKQMHTKYMGIPGKKDDYKRLPRKIYRSFKETTLPNQWDPKKKYTGFGGPIVPHPSFRRQIKLAAIILEEIYNKTIDKIFLEEISQKIKNDALLIAIFNLSNNEFRYAPKKIWLSLLLIESLSKDWSKELVENWLKHFENRKEKKITPNEVDQLLDLIFHWLIEFSQHESQILDNTKILALQTLPTKEYKEKNNDQNINIMKIILDPPPYYRTYVPQTHKSKVDHPISPDPETTN